MDEMTRLASTLAAKPHLDEDELAVYRSLLAYIELHARLACMTLTSQLKAEGISDEDLRGYSQTNN